MTTTPPDSPRETPPKKKRALLSKIALIGACALGIGVLVLLIGAVAIFALLPSPGEIAKILKPHARSLEQLQAANVSVETPATDSGTTRAIEAQIEEAVQAPRSTSENEFLKRMKDPKVQAQYQEAFDRLFEEDPTDIRVCDNLGRVEMSTTELGRPRSILELIGPRDGNAVFEAFRFPIVSALHDPDLKAFYYEAKDYERNLEGLSDAEKNSWLRKAGFYSKLAKTMTGFLSRRERIESAATQGKALLKLAQITATNSKLASDARVQDLCREIENSARSESVSKLGEYDQDIEQLMAENKVAPEALQNMPILEAIEYKKSKSAGEGH